MDSIGSLSLFEFDQVVLIVLRVLCFACAECCFV